MLTKLFFILTVLKVIANKIFIVGAKLWPLFNIDLRNKVYLFAVYWLMNASGPQAEFGLLFVCDPMHL